MTAGHVYTHGHHESVLRSHRWRTAQNSAGYLLPQLRAGQRLLDVGCGPGTITLDLARLVSPGPVIGIDASESVIRDATATAEAVPNVTFQTGDVYTLDFPDDSFDIVHAHQVLQHLADPVAALREMRRVCAPDGLVAARDSDYAAMTWFPEVPEMDEWMALYHAIARGNGAEPDAGRRLVSWGRTAGFAEVTASASAWCFADPTDRDWWAGSWADRVTMSTLASQAIDRDLASREDLNRISAAWRRWATHEDAWFAVVHGEIRCRG